MKEINIFGDYWGGNRSNISMACGVKGTLCSIRIFMRSAGMVHNLLSRSISTHSAFVLSLGRVMVCNCHSIKHLVVSIMLA